jgi:MFS family permease
LPFLFVLYIANYVDRTNLAYAAVGMSRDLGFSDRVFGLGAGIFFLSYLALQIPGARLVERWSARRVITMTMVAWGLLTVLTGLVQTPGQLYLARFALGVAESAFFPGVIVYLSHWFIQQDRAKAISNFMGAVPLSAVLGSPLAGWILGRAWLGLQGWRWLFAVEGLPAILLGAVAFFYLTDWPHQAAWLGPEQRNWIQAQLQQESPVRPNPISIREALRSRIILLLGGLTFLNYFAVYTFIFWFPTLLKRQSGFSDLKVGFWGMVPYLATFLAMQFIGWNSDRTQERVWHAAVPMFVAAAGYLALTAQPHSSLVVVALFAMVGMGLAQVPTVWALATEILSPAVAATAVGMINAIGSIAGFFGPYAFGYLYTRTGSFSTGYRLAALAALAGGTLLLFVPKRKLQIDPAER